MLVKVILGKEMPVAFECNVEIVLSQNNEKEQCCVETQLIKLSITKYKAYLPLIFAMSPQGIFTKASVQ